MTDGSSSPLSSPPKSPLLHPSPATPTTIELGSPARSTEGLASSGNRREPTVEPAEDTRGGSTEGATTQDVDAAEKKPALYGSGKSGRAASQKRQASNNFTSSVSKKVRRAFSGAKKSAQDKKWDAPAVYTKHNSPLAKADLRDILLHPEAWEILGPAEKQAVLAQFPDNRHVLEGGTPEARPNIASLRNDDNFRTDCARYCENVGEGRHDEDWLKQAWIAHYRNKRGGHDEYLRESFEKEWGWMLPEEAKPESAESEPQSEAKSTEPKGAVRVGSSKPEPKPQPQKPTPEKAAPDQPSSTVESPAEGKPVRKLRRAGGSNGSPPERKPPAKSNHKSGIKDREPEATAGQEEKAKPEASATKPRSSRLTAPPRQDAKSKGSANSTPSSRPSTSPSPTSSKARGSQGREAGRSVIDNRPA